MTEATPKRLKVALLTGGDSSERAVCFATASSVANALDASRFDVTIFDVSLPQTRAFDPYGGDRALGTRPRHVIVGVDWNTLITQLYTTGFDVVFPALHGGRGEDGTLQALLEIAGVPYVGSGTHACAIAIDKQVCKAFMSGYEIAVPHGRIFWNWEQWQREGAEWRDKPCVVKPNAGGSSVATTIFSQAPTEDEMKNALQAAFDDGSGALVEELVTGTEVTCAVLGAGENARALPIIEIVPKSDSSFYDYAAKYHSGGSQHLIPPRLDVQVLAEIEKCALRAHRALGCRGVARSDYIVRDDGTSVFLEINTLPGMTSTSLVPDAARAAGVEFPQLLERLLQAALEKKQD